MSSLMIIDSRDCGSTLLAVEGPYSSVLVLSSTSRSSAFSRQAPAEKPLPTLVEMMRQRSLSYSWMAVRSLRT